MKKYLFLILTALLVIGTFEAGYSEPKKLATDKYGGTMRLVTPQGPSTAIGWTQDARGLSFLTINFCIETMFVEDKKGNIKPCLATSYEINTDPQNSSITFHLRKGVKFHDGSDFNAHVVKWNYETLKSVPGRMRDWKSFDVLDEYTIRINLTHWQNRFIRQFAGPPTNIMSKQAFETKGKDWMREHMVGTGPWVQTEYIKDVSIKFKRNENYWDKGKPYMDGVELLFVADPFAREVLLKTGEVDALAISYADFPIVSGIIEKGFQVLIQPTQTTFLVPDSKNDDSPWSDPRVRMAAEYAIDRDAVSKNLGYGYAHPLTQLVSSNNLAYDPDLKTRGYDPAKARKLLAAAGYPEGFKTKIIHPPPPIADKHTVGAVQAYLAAVGIEAEINMVSPSKMAQYRARTTWDNALLWAVMQEHANFNATLGNHLRIGALYFKSLAKPPGWAEMVNASLTSVEMDQKLLRKCVGAAFDYAMIIPLNIASSIYAVNPKLHDTGFCDRESNLNSNTQNAWFSKE